MHTAEYTRIDEWNTQFTCGDFSAIIQTKHKWRSPADRAAWVAGLRGRLEKGWPPHVHARRFTQRHTPLEAAVHRAKHHPYNAQGAKMTLVEIAFCYGVAGASYHTLVEMASADWKAAAGSAAPGARNATLGFPA